MTLTLHAGNLLFKYGFADGDLVWNWVAEHMWPPYTDPPPELAVANAALLRLVTEHLLPAVAAAGHAVVMSTYALPAMHNPARAASIDGIEVGDRGEWPDGTPTLDGICVEVTAEQIRAALIKALGEES